MSKSKFVIKQCPDYFVMATSPKKVGFAKYFEVNDSHESNLKELRFYQK